MSLLARKLLASAAPTGIQFVGGKVAAIADVAAGNSTIDLTSGLTGGIASAVSDGDFVIAAYSISANFDVPLTITDGSSNYTLIGSELTASDDNDANLRAAYKFVSGDTSTSFGQQISGRGGAAGVYVFRGVNTTTPMDVTVTTATGTNSILANPPSITPSTSGSFIVCVGAGSHQRGTGATYSSSSLTDFLTISGGTSFQAILGIGQKDDWTSGAFDCAAFTFSASDATAYSWAALSMALRPA